MMTGRIASTKVSADYLHANSTNHTWALGAVAEFFDNCCDAKAREVQIDVVNLGDKLCLYIQDDGIGMGKDELYNMLSFGFCGRHLSAAIGKYGNGFKSGSMRLGKDTIVFTRNLKTAGVGLLSQTFNSNMEAETVLVPMLHYSLPDLMHGEDEAHSENLAAILKNSMFENEENLKKQIRQLPKTGTSIIIYNLHRTCDSSYLELDFDTDPADIRCPDFYDAGNEQASKYRVSLKEYCSILYLKPRMKIKLRGNYVKTKLIAKSLCSTQVDEYIPKVSTSEQEDIYARRGQTNTIIFGFLPNSTDSEDYGMMLYSDNRLIKPYEKVSCQRRGDGVGAGVVGVTQAKFLTPTNMKQDFVRDQKYMSAMKAYNTKLKNYWENARAQLSASSSRRSPDSLWVQCDKKKCLKWRRLPPGVQPTQLPNKWYCNMHPDNISCDLPEDMHEDEDVIQPPSRSRSVSSRTAEPITGKKRKRNNLSLSVDSDIALSVDRDIAQSSQSLTAVDKAGASSNQNAHYSKYANSSHLRVSKRVIRGSTKKQSQVHNEKVVVTSSHRKTRKVNSEKVGCNFLRRKTRQVNSSETVCNSVKSATNQALGRARCTEGSSGSEASVENQHEPGDDSFCGDETVDDDHLSAGTKQTDGVNDVTADSDNIINVTFDTEHDDDNNVTHLPVGPEPRSNSSSSVDDDDDAEEADSSNLQEPENELSQLRSELKQLREKFNTLLNNSRRLLAKLAPQINIDINVDIEQLIANMVEHDFP